MQREHLTAIFIVQVIEFRFGQKSRVSEAGRDSGYFFKGRNRRFVEASDQFYNNKKMN